MILRRALCLVLASALPLPSAMAQQQIRLPARASPGSVVPAVSLERTPDISLGDPSLGADPLQRGLPPVAEAAVPVQNEAEARLVQAQPAAARPTAISASAQAAPEERPPTGASFSAAQEAFGSFGAQGQPAQPSQSALDRVFDRAAPKPGAGPAVFSTLQRFLRASGLRRSVAGEMPAIWERPAAAVGGLGLLASTDQSWMGIPQAAFILGSGLAMHVVLRQLRKAGMRAGIPELALAALLGGTMAVYAAHILITSPVLAGAALLAVAASGYLLYRKVRASDFDDPRTAFGEKPLFKLRRREGKLVMSVREDQLGVPFLLSATMEKGLGTKMLYSSLPMSEARVYFRRAGDQLQLMEENTDFRADPGSPEEPAVKRSFSDSIVASVPILDREGFGSRRSWSIPLEKIFLKDIFGVGDALKEAYPEAEPYRADEAASALPDASVFERNVEIHAALVFSSPAPDFRTPVPDPRSLSFGMRYSLAALPRPGYVPRRADERVGYFAEIYRDFTRMDRSAPGETPHGRLIQRWRLEKSDPAASVSPVKEPIVWWIENTVPQEYRQAVREGVLTWNKAFERIGLKDALVVREQPEPGSPGYFDAADARYNMIRWYAGDDATFALGNLRSDPKTGQIYNGVINFSVDILRGKAYRSLHEVLGDDKARHKHGPSCRFARETALALEHLRARPDISDAQRELFSQKMISSYIVHEVGHAIGLGHNFAASAFRSLKELEEAPDGILSQSVMDYAALNFRGVPVQVELGPYDYLAVEYGYKPLEHLSESGRNAELARIASHIGEPGLEYAGDEEVEANMDPYAAHFDLGPDPLEFARASVARVSAFWRSLAARELPKGSDYHALRREFELSLETHYRRAVQAAARYIGGVRQSRVRAGQNAGRPPYEAIPAEKQREALEFLNRYLFSDEMFRLPPDLLAKFAQDLRAQPADSLVPRHLPLNEIVTRERVQILQSLLHPERLRRLSEGSGGAQAYTLHDLFSGLDHLIWYDSIRDASVLRRELQAAYVDILLEMVDKPEEYAERMGTKKLPPSDAVKEAHASLMRLLAYLPKVGKKTKGLGLEIRNHMRHLHWKIDDALDPRPE